MNAKRFDEIFEARIAAMLATLASKGKEYSSDDDRLYNFKRGAEIERTTPERALLGMMTKHVVSVIDLIEGRVPLTESAINEKFGDNINYLVLGEAALKEKLDLQRLNEANQITEKRRGSKK